MKSVLVKSIWLSLGGFWLLWPLGQLQRFEVLGNWPVYGTDFVMLISLSLMVWYFKDRIRLLPRPSPLLMIGAGLVVLSWGLAAISDLPVEWGLAYTGRLALGAGWGWLTAEWFVRHRHHTPFSQSVTVWVTLALIVAAWFGWLQYLFQPDVRWLSVLGWDDHLYRAVGAFFDPNFLGLALVWLIWLVLGQHWPRGLKFILLLLTGALLVVTYSRISYLALGITSLYWLWQTHKRLDHHLLAHKSWLLIGAIIAAVGIFWLAPKPTGEGVRLLRTSSIYARLDTAQQVVAHQSPLAWLFGEGWLVPTNLGSSVKAGLEITTTARQPDNLILVFVQGIGVVGLGWVLMLLWSERRHWPSLSTTTQLIVIATFVHSMTNFSFFQALFWPVLVLMVSSDWRSAYRRN